MDKTLYFEYQFQILSKQAQAIHHKCLKWKTNSYSLIHLSEEKHMDEKWKYTVVVQ